MIRDLERPLLGRHAAESLNLLTRVNSIAKGDYKAKVRHKYPQLFIGLGRMKAEYTITLKENPKPYAITVPRKVPLPLVKETKEEIIIIQFLKRIIHKSQCFYIRFKVITRIRLKIYYRLKAILKRCVLSLVLKESKVSEYLIKSGSLFQSLRDTHAKDLSP